MIRPSERIWALVSGYAAPVRAARLLALFQTYTDDSGRGDPAVFCLAGFVSTAPQWAAFSDEWFDTLGHIKYFKGTEAAALQKQFHGMSEDARDLLVSRLCKVINKHILYGVRGVVDARAWSRIAFAKYDKSANLPYAFVANDIMCTVMNEQYRRGLPGQVDFIFDTQSPKEFEYVLEGWRAAKSGRVPRLSEAMPKFHRRRMGQPPYPLDDKITAPLQAADLLAWTTYRNFTDTLEVKKTPLVEVVVSEFDDTPILTNDRLIGEYFSLLESLGFDYEAFRREFKPTRRQRRRIASSQDD